MLFVSFYDYTAICICSIERGICFTLRPLALARDFAGSLKDMLAICNANGGGASNRIGNAPIKLSALRVVKKSESTINVNKNRNKNVN